MSTIIYPAPIFGPSIAADLAYPSESTCFRETVNSVHSTASIASVDTTKISAPNKRYRHVKPYVKHSKSVWLR